MAHWTQQIAEAYRALQEAELLKGRAAPMNEKVSIKIPFTNKSIVYRSGTDTHAAIAHLDALHRRLWKDTDVGGERNHKVFDPNHHDPEIAEILNDRKKKIRKGQI